MKNICYILSFLAVAVCFSGCIKTAKNTVTTSDDATLKSMTFVANDSFPGLAAAVFTIDNRLDTDTGLIYNIDSLLYGTRIDSVVARFVFNQQIGTANIYTIDDTLELTGRDTINFLQRPTRLFAISSDLQHSKWYNIYVNVHQVDPDLYEWNELNDNIYTVAEGDLQHAFYANEQFYLFVLQNGQVKLYTSQDATEWTENTVEGLPTDVKLKSILPYNNMLYYAQENMLYSSADGMVWENKSSEQLFERLLFTFNDSLWAITRHDEQLALCVTGNCSDWREQMTLPETFPTDHFTTTTFYSSSLRKRAVVIGGTDKDGNLTASRWNVEYSASRGYVWSDFTGSRHPFEPLADAAIVSYDEKLYLFGGTDKDNHLRDAMLVSDDEGISWQVPDSAHNKLPETYKNRSRHSVFTDTHSNLFIVGGKDSLNTCLSDVYKGRLNSIDWEKK